MSLKCQSDVVIGKDNNSRASSCGCEDSGAEENNDGFQEDLSASHRAQEVREVCAKKALDYYNSRS